MASPTKMGLPFFYLGRGERGGGEGGASYEK